MKKIRGAIDPISLGFLLAIIFSTAAVLSEQRMNNEMKEKVVFPDK